MDKILNIANHIINICIDLEKPINVFNLQKILFLANEKYHKKLFKDKLIYIPKYPYPRYEKVFKEYMIYGATPIVLKAEVEKIKKKKTKILHETIKENINLAPWEMNEKIIRILGYCYE